MTSLLEKEIRKYEENKEIIRLHLITGSIIVGSIDNHDDKIMMISRSNLAKDNKVTVQIKHIVYMH